MEIAVPKIGAFHFESQIPQRDSVNSNVFEETRSKLNERGENLKILESRHQLATGANDFITMAKKLREKTEGGSKHKALAKLPLLKTLGKVYLDEIAKDAVFVEVVALLDNYWEKMSETFPQIPKEVKEKLKTMKSGQIQEILRILLESKERVTVLQFVSHTEKALASVVENAWF